jgi:hypothetical protein
MPSALCDIMVNDTLMYCLAGSGSCGFLPSMDCSSSASLISVILTVSHLVSLHNVGFVSGVSNALLVRDPQVR